MKATNINHPPCIRGLDRFKKTGCPEHEWDGLTGCPAWRRMSVPRRDNPMVKNDEAKCLDQWQFDFAWASLGLLEGNQAATESFRNNMTTADGPRPDPAMLAMLKVVVDQEKRKLPYDV